MKELVKYIKKWQVYQMFSKVFYIMILLKIGSYLSLSWFAVFAPVILFLIITLSIAIYGSRRRNKGVS